MQPAVIDLAQRRERGVEDALLGIRVALCGRKEFEPAH
jgi:hypothetical protein